MEIMVEVHGVLHLVIVEVGTGVTYQYVEVRQSRSRYIEVAWIRYESLYIWRSLELIQYRPISFYNSIKTFHFYILCLTIPHTDDYICWREWFNFIYVFKKMTTIGRGKYYFVGKAQKILWNWYLQSDWLFDRC